MTERQKLTLAKLRDAIVSEFSNKLGRDADGYMPSVRIFPRAGEPNWRAEIASDIGISVLGSFLVSLDHVKAVYDLDDESRERLLSQKGW